VTTNVTPAPLAFLSLQHCPRGATPSAYTNEERARAHAALRPMQLGNAHPCKHLSRTSNETTMS
jgi:hypothetical protein